MSEAAQTAPLRSSAAADERRRLLDQSYRENLDALLRFARARHASPADAEEIAQEAYLRLCRADAIQTVGNLRGFLYRTARNLLVDRYRATRQANGITEIAPLSAGEPGLDEIAATEQELAALRAAIMELPPRCREVFIMHRLNQMTHTEICRELRISHQMVERHIAKAIRRCRERLLPLRPTPRATRAGRTGDDHDG